MGQELPFGGHPKEQSSGYSYNLSGQRRVCHISTMTRWGGVERMLGDLLSHSRPDSPIRHFLLATSSLPEVIRPVQAAGIPFFQPTRRWHYDPQALWQMAGWLRQQKIEVVHSYNAFANSWGWLAARLARVPRFIAGEHGTIWTAKPAIAWLDRLAQRSANLVIANSQATALGLQKLYGLPTTKIRVVWNGVADLPPAGEKRLRHQFQLGNRFIVGSIGRLDSPKQFSTFLEAAALLAPTDPEIHFVLVGGGPLHESLNQQAIHLNLSHRLTLTGWREDARHLLGDFDLFVSTSLYETFGNSLVEAALAGKAVIAPAVGGIPEIVVDGQTGMLLKPTRPIAPNQPGLGEPLPKQMVIDGQLSPLRALEPGQLAQAIEQLKANPTLRQAMGCSGRERASRLFTIDQYANQLEKIYR